MQSTLSVPNVVKAGERCQTYTGKWQPVAHAKRKRAAFEEEIRGEGEQGAGSIAPQNEDKRINRSSLSG